MRSFSTPPVKTNTFFKILLLNTFILCYLPLSMCAQTLETGNNPNAVNAAVSAIVTDNTGKIYVGGAFTTINQWSRGDAKFSTSTGIWDNTRTQVGGGQIRAVVAIPTAWGGGWYIGGGFTSINGITRNRLARINADGSLHDFDPNMNNIVYTLALGT